MNGFGKATAEIINRFEEYIGFSLPEDYKAFLMECNGGTPTVRYSSFFVEALARDIPLNALLGLGINKFNLKKRFDECVSDLPPNTLIIGDDADKGVVLLANGEMKKGVYYGERFAQSYDDRKFYKIADDFHSFLTSLQKR